jgi:hypothetical protein
MAKEKKSRDRDEERSRDRSDRPTPKNDAYVIMLLITFFAILAGCVLLYLDADQYAGKSPPKEVLPALTDLGKGGAADGKGGDSKPGMD